MNSASLRPHLALGLVPLLLCACGGSADGFTLALVPRLIEGQQPFDNAPDVKLLIQHAAGETEILSLGTAGSGDTVDLTEVGDIATGSTLGIIAQTPGGDPDAYDPDALLAYGQVTLDADLSTSEDDVELEILVPQIDVIGELGTLSANNATASAGVAMIPGGDVFLFGGAKEVFDSLGSSKILRMSNTDSGDWSFEAIDLKMPKIEDEAAKLTGCSATTVMVDGQPLIFVAGGRPGEENTPLDGGIGQNSKGAWLFDPQTEEVVWEAARMEVGRSQHRALRLDNGKVLLYGGYRGFDGYNANGSFELFDPEKKRFSSEETGVGDYFEAAGSLGADGALICGGASRVDDFALSTCVQVSPSGDVGDAASLPKGVFGHAMVSLGDGMMLATGGVTIPTQDNEDNAASNEAWLYNGSTWSALDSTMAMARAHHMMIPLPDGRILIVGGVESAGPLYSMEGPSIQRSEIFDPNTLNFELIGGSLTDAGAGAHPTFATWPGEGAFVLAGYDDLGSPPDATYGLVGLGPDL
jgi:hypothetical protein